MKRENLPYFVSRLVGGRPVRWVSPDRLVGDYDGRERTLQVFNADPPDQAKLRRDIDAFRDVLRDAAGGPLVILFHSVKQSEERYADVIRAFPRLLHVRPDVAPPVERCVDAADESGPHRKVA